MSDRPSITRRELLQGASLGIAASMAGSIPSAWAQAAQPGAGATARKGRLTPDQLPRSWTVEELQRRWTITREAMNKAQLDCLLVSQHHSGAMIAERMDGDADIEWLTGNSLPFKYVVFPANGKITAISTSQVRNTREDGIAQQMGIEIRVAEELWSAAVIDCLREKGMDAARIGVTNLADAPRQPEGEINYTTYDRVLKAFPQAKFVAAGDLLWRVKIVHSPEEVTVLERATEVGEIGLQAMMETARPGVRQREVWIAMFAAMVNASGERPWRLSIRAGGPGNSSLNRPLEEVMQAGQILSQECSGCVLGYGSQVNHSVLLGAPAPEDWTSMGQYCLDTFQAIVDAMAPGRTIKEICALYDSQLSARGLKPGGIVLHSGGLGDLPRAGTTNRNGADVVLQAGMVFDVKPGMALKDRRSVQFGDSVAVTGRGARRLGKREMKLVTLGAALT